MRYSAQPIALCVNTLETQRAPGGCGVPKGGLPMRSGVYTRRKELVDTSILTKRQHNAFKREKVNHAMNETYRLGMSGLLGALQAVCHFVRQTQRGGAMIEGRRPLPRRNTCKHFRARTFG
eukprot:5235547-Amphidinium_carterae.1